ncbi:MAG: trigger factor [Kiritimatiellae bacterium]|nr:trigger factor [Kiritimatiellia bacterium]MDD4341855.1 trigger factor [Kiritimatiellia bacterium]
MKVTVESTGPCRTKLQVEFGAQEVQAEYDESLAVYVKHGRVKGFRPGRAPVEMIRRQYDQTILESVRERLLAKGYQQAMKEHDIEPITESELTESELKAGLPFSFSVTLEIEPKFELPVYKGLDVEAKTVQVTDEAVAEAIDRYLESRGKYEDVADPRPVQANDMVAVDYTATVDGAPMADVSEKAKDLATGSDFWVIASEEYSFLPTFGPQLVGMKPGDTKDISITFDDQWPIEELRGKTGVFQATVKKVRVRQKAKMDAALFETLKVNDEADLRKSFKEMLEREAQSQEDARRRDQVLDAVMKGATIEVPASQVQREANSMVYEMVQENMRRGVSEKEIRDNIGKITESAQSAAGGRVKLRYLLERIAREEKIPVLDAEVSSLMTAQAMRAGHPTTKAWLQAAKLKEKDVCSSLKQDLLVSKTIDFLLANAKMTGDGAAVPAQKKEAKA